MRGRTPRCSKGFYVLTQRHVLSPDNTIFWRQGWRRSRLFHPPMPSIKPVAWVRNEPEGNNSYSIILMLVELQWTTGKEHYFFILPEHPFKISSLHFLTSISIGTSSCQRTCGSIRHTSAPSGRKLRIRQVFSQPSHQGPVD